ncbi:PqqD family peptide modification chaperone [Halomonas sp. LS-001]
MTSPSPTSLKFWLSGQRHAEQDHFFRTTLEASGWQEGDDTDWQAAWVTGMPPKAAFQATSPQRRMNHIPGNAALTVKSRLHDSLSRMRKRIIAHYGEDHTYAQRLEFFPRAYEMPHDYPAMVEDAAANPQKRWILKPTNASKGQGIRVISDPTQAPLATNWLVQEYVGNPHTIRGHKYVLRLYMLIAGIDPLRIYLYRQGFAKLASAPWDPDDIDNVYSQLTNPDINARNQAAEVPVEFIDFERYRQWLKEQGHDDQALFDKLEDLATLTALSGVDAMRARSRENGADPLGCYELIGLDCLVDDQLKPWILECNLSPSLGVCARPEHGGIVEEQVKGDLIRDMIQLLGLDKLEQAPTHFDAAALSAEHQRTGNFATLYPSALSDYTPFVGLPSSADSQLTPERLVSVRPHRVSELFDNDQLALYQHDSGQFIQLNDSAALIWLLLGDGQPINAVIEQLLTMTDTPREHVEQDVWATLAVWQQYGLLAPQDSTSPEPLQADAERTPAQQTLWLNIDQCDWRITAPQGAVADQLQADFTPLKPHKTPDTADQRLHVLASANGYCLADDSKLLRSRLHFNEIRSAIEQCLLNQAAGEHAVIIDLAVVTIANQQIAVRISQDDDQLALLADFANRHGATVTRGIRLNPAASAGLEPLNLPVKHAPYAAIKECQPEALVTLTAESQNAASTNTAFTTLSECLPCTYQGQRHALEAQALSLLHEICQPLPHIACASDPAAFDDACQQALGTTAPSSLSCHPEVDGNRAHGRLTVP